MLLLSTSPSRIYILLVSSFPLPPLVVIIFVVALVMSNGERVRALRSDFFLLSEEVSVSLLAAIWSCSFRRSFIRYIEDEPIENRTQESTKDQITFEERPPPSDSFSFHSLRACPPLRYKTDCIWSFKYIYALMRKRSSCLCFVKNIMPFKHASQEVSYHPTV